jgi:RNA polymerase sigma-70 factor (ECF subfamily)
MGTHQRAVPVHFVARVREVRTDAAMARYADGDEAAFAELYDGLAPQLIAYLRRRTPDRALVEDLVQETFLRIHLHRGRFRGDAPVRPWAFTIAARLLANRVRGVRRANTTFFDEERASERPAEASGPEQQAIATELAERIEHEVQRLPDTDREAFDLVKREGVSLKLAASRLSTTTMALKMRLFRICGRLRRSSRADSGPGERKRP